MAPLLRSALALLPIVASLVSLVTAQDHPIPLVCQEGVQIIAVVGTNVTNGTFSLSASFVNHVMNAIPNSANFSLNYNRFPGNQTAQQTFIPEVDEGVPALYEALQNYTTACPKTPIVLHGYSEGAVVVMNLLCGASSGAFPVTSPLNASFADQIISVITYGDETRTANQSFDLGSCTANAPHLPRRTPKGCNAFSSRLQGYCFKNDVDCCGTANASAPWPYGINPHFLYPAAFDADATKFVVSHYDKYKNITTSTSSASTTTTSKSSTLTTSKKTTTTSSKPITTTTKTTKSATTTTTPSSLSIQTTCSKSIDACLTSFANHPTTASRFCSSYATGKTPSPVFTGVCTATNKASQYSSVCGCLVLSSTSSSTSTITSSVSSAANTADSTSASIATSTDPSFATSSDPSIATSILTSLATSFATNTPISIASISVV